MANNKIRISIAGAEYSIIAEDDAKYVQSLGKALDLKMSDIMKANSRVSTTQAAMNLFKDDESYDAVYVGLDCLYGSRRSWSFHR